MGIEQHALIEARLANGEDFGGLAQNYSEDPSTASTSGDLGFIPQSSLEKADITNYYAQSIVESFGVSD